MVNVVQGLHDLADLFVPRRCAGCDVGLMRNETALCMACAGDLPLARSVQAERNAVERIFFGRLQLEAAGAFLKFDPEGVVQHMLHRLKYKGDREVGLELGRRMARELLSSDRFSTVDTVIAVPLHPRKMRTRGYNQAQVLVDGMREVWPLRDPGSQLLRLVSTRSQTKKSRLERWRNVEHAFDLAEPEALRDAHVLLVDDVVTTGATIEACARALSDVPGLRLSVFTCAYA